MTKNYHKNQINIIKICKNFIKKAEKFNIPTHIDPSYYLCSWSNIYGNAQLRKISKIKISFFDYLVTFIKTQFVNFKFSNFNTTTPTVLKKRFKNIVISWLISDEYIKKGKLYDRYFNMYAKDNLETLWIVICYGKLIKVPKIKEKNVIFVQEEFNNFLVTITKIFFNFLNLKSKKNSNKFALSIFDEVFKRIINHKIKNMIIPYEGQPFQNYIFYNTHKYFPQVRTYGYVHSMLPALPTTYIKRNGAPQKILTTGKAQKEILIKYLGWKYKEVKTLPTLRFLKNNKISINQKILLPIDFFNSKLILSTLNNYLINCENLSLPVMKIRNHPAAEKSKRHKLLIKKINIILQRNSKKFSKKIKKNISIIIGWTASIFEALDNNIKVIHICSEPLFESFQKKLWKHLEVTKINSNLFMYILKRKSMYISINDKKYKNLTKWLKV